MKKIVSRRDIGYTIISRFEECFRIHVSKKLKLNYFPFEEGIPAGIVRKTNDRADQLNWTDPLEFLENTDFPDLSEICLYKINFIQFFTLPNLAKEEFQVRLSILYSLRCKIAHVKGYFTSLDLDKLIDISTQVAKEFDDAIEFLDMLKEIQINPQDVIVVAPSTFTINFFETNGIINNLPIPDYEYEGGFVGRNENIKQVIKYLKSEKFPVISITGAGGVGKTALALKAVQELNSRNDNPFFNAVVWMSAKENRLSALGIQDIEPTLRDYEELLDTIISVLGFHDDIEENTIEYKEEFVETLLDISNSVLVIIDNLETITDERIINFIIDAPLTMMSPKAIVV